jgi:dinuclear metal center YbgI/SA1388 family protein
VKDAGSRNFDFVYLSFMTINEVTAFLESIAPPAYQEQYDNAGLLTGSGEWECKGIIVSLDATEEVINEAMKNNCNLVVSHHPIIFSGLKKINGKNYIEKAIITAIKNDIALYAIHTNLDNIYGGVNSRIAEMLGLTNTRILDYKDNTLKKLFTFVPLENASDVRSAIFAAGGGNIGQYSQCSFNTEGKGTFKAKPGTDPYIGEIGELTTASEVKIEVIFPAYQEKNIVAALLKAHPYEEVAFDVVELSNHYQNIGSGLIGELPEVLEEKALLSLLKKTFKAPVIRHTALLGKPVKTVAICGGSGSFLLSKAIAAKADMYITADMKYHQFFDADGRLVVADIGHYESEQFTINLLSELLEQKFTTFAVLKTTVDTNPVNYFIEA